MKPVADASEWDRRDCLASFRERFYRPQSAIYLDGNSLGLLSDAAEASVLQALESWKRSGIEAWTQGPEPWFTLAESLAARLAPLMGAEPAEITVANSTTVNLHQILATLYRPSSDRFRILTDSEAFPTDLYAIQSHLRLHGYDPVLDLILVPPGTDGLLDEGDIIDAIRTDVHLVLLPAVSYKSGQLLDMQRLTAAAHHRGAIIGFDCAHSVGAVPHALSESGVDFAIWCSYKYLNAGPGAAAGLYLNQRHFDVQPGLAGWFGSDKARQFDMAPEMTPAYGAGRMQIGSPNILSMAPLMGSIELIEEAGLDRMRAKSIALTGYLIDLADSHLAEFGIQVRSPRKAQRRGGHVAFAHPDAARICRALRAAHVVPDFRPPNLIRLAPAPLYNSFSDCAEAIQIFRGIMVDRVYEQAPAGRDVVT